MDTALAEMPLAIFTTLAPVGAGAFIALAVAFFTNAFTEKQLKKIDRMTCIPLILVIVGLAASFAHLANPGNAMGVFAGIGSSPLSNEILTACLFTLVALVYWIWAMTGKMGTGARKGMSALAAVLAVVFAIFTGLAYSIETIASWSTPAVPLAILGFALLGGTALGCMVLGSSFADAAKTPFRPAAIALVAIGLVLALLGVFMQFGLASGQTTYIADGAQMASSVTGYMIGGVALLIAGAILAASAVMKKPTVALAGGATAAILVGVFLARLVFYSLQISVGLAL